MSKNALSQGEKHNLKKDESTAMLTAVFWVTVNEFS